MRGKDAPRGTLANRYGRKAQGVRRIGARSLGEAWKAAQKLYELQETVYEDPLPVGTFARQLADPQWSRIEVVRDSRRQIIAS